MKILRILVLFMIEIDITIEFKNDYNNSFYDFELIDEKLTTIINNWIDLIKPQY